MQQFPNLQKLLEVMQRLRDPEDGCPWDRKQSFQSIVPFTIEEAYEVADAIEHGSMEDIKDELGDLLFQVVFYAQLGQEQNEFDFEAVAGAIVDKLIRRHPHVFADAEIDCEAQLNRHWDKIKQQERLSQGKASDNSVLANIPAGMAPLMRANKIQKRCAKVGFDWPELAPVVDKIHEEIDEVMQEVNQPKMDQQAVEEEMGDLLFAVVNLSRHLKVEPETALRKANHKFEQRFRAVEQHFIQRDLAIEQATLDEMEDVWQRVKAANKGNQA
ncbi:nucleoside triphosphate pyrophosphohydrolase [Neptunicella sp. SCSIO 80796]|uniref:nucleoside triphosphate pyrophosphohydrolase n=1 Tax=Neptunicella plasticusilytica TaxID=3117012 RepID=UPI003A4E3248